MRLLPPDKDLGWTPYAWLIYLGFFFVQPVMDHAGWREWLATAFGAAALLVLYFAGWWLKGRRVLWVMAGITLLGIAFAPFNVGASVIFVYAAAFAGCAGGAKFAAGLVAAICVALTGETLLLHLPVEFWIFGTVFSILVGAVNIHYAQRKMANSRLRMAQDEIEHLAKVAERERIARDMHDVLGHTLSVVILKSELAAKLVEQNPAGAKQEMSDVESIARQALAEVRNAIGGYRSEGLAAELSHAEATLETAGVGFDCAATPIHLSPSEETVLALALREAVTNVVRHACAGLCRVRLEPFNGGCRMQIEDNGRGGPNPEGNGLRGMRERVEALGGTLVREADSGTTLTITLPLPPERRNATS
ncbi:MAG: sensor histidine kinase [Acidobacteriota bacterium]|nr:sensor histidine kinase [Acidobacteriota bacterium]